MESAEFYLSIINELQEGIYYVDRDRRILFWNQGAEAITGYAAGEIVGKCCQCSGLNHIDCQGKPLCSLGCPLFATLGDGIQRQDLVYLRHKDGHRIPVRVNIFPVRKDGAITGAVEVFTRETQRLYDDDLIDQLTRAAMQDPLTDLPNRRHTESFLSYKLQEFQQFGRPMAVLYADIDDFSVINNHYGHDMGDAVLKNVTQTLKNALRRDDLIGRWGGEELLGVYNIRDPRECPGLAERFRSLVEGTLTRLGDQTVQVTISVGVTPVRPGDTAQTITQRADKLMYESKHRGKNRVTADVS